MQNGKWLTPSDEVMRRVVHTIEHPLELLSQEQMVLESDPSQVSDPEWSRYANEVRDHPDRLSRLPWRNVDLSVIIAVNRVAGPDDAVALDYRHSRTNPSVIATEWGQEAISWRLLYIDFDQFAAALGLIST